MLKKREIFRECFDNFEFDKIAAYDDSDVERILATEGMIRSPRKVQAVINNARCYRQVREEFGSFCNYIWGFSGGKTILYQGHAKGPIPVSNGLSDRISKDLKKRGFKYVGAMTIYSHLQACGIINDHEKGILSKKGWFTPPFSTEEQLMNILKRLYKDIDFHVDGSMVYFCCT